MHWFGGRRIELAVANACSRGHALSVAGKDDRSGSQAVFVLQLAFEDIGDDFHVAVRMRGKPGVGRDVIFVDDAQGAESHPLWIPVIREAEGVFGVEPTVVSATTLVGRTNGNHELLRSLQKSTDTY